MGQKVNPNGLRLGINKDWQAKWYAKGKDFSKNLEKDVKIREYLTENLKNAGIAKVEIGLLFTEDINDYNAEEYPVPLRVFPAEIPSNAEVVSFSYFDYWSESEDVYLELKFNSLAEMNAYLSEVKASCLQTCANYTPPLNGEWFIEEQNIYDERYTELFCTLYSISQREETYTGYVIKNISNEAVYICNFGVICYSVDELTVIHTLVSGSFQDSVHNHTPKYFSRFVVPLDQKHNRKILLVTQGTVCVNPCLDR